MPCGCGNPTCTLAPFTFEDGTTSRPLSQWTWFASLGIAEEPFWLINEWQVRLRDADGVGHERFVGRDGSARTTSVLASDMVVGFPMPDGRWGTWRESYSEPWTLAPAPEVDPVPLRVPPPSRSDLRRGLRSVAEDESEDEPTCEHCGDAEDDCRCVECPERHCDRKGPAEDLNLCDVCDACDSCCECVECSHRRCNWRGRERDRCETCERCNDHCECMWCESCDTRVRDGWCSDCDRCGDCCEGHNNGERPELYDAPLRFHEAPRGAYKRNPSRRFVAVEIEVAAVDGESNAEIESTCKRWKASITEDGSLPDDTGFEIPTAPANGDKFCEQIEAICGALKSGNGAVDGSCGLHVHVDARDYRHYDMRRLVMLYAKLEDALFATQPTSRLNGGYCDPCGERYMQRLAEAKTPKASKHTLMANVYAGAIGERRDTSVADAMYEADRTRKNKKRAPASTAGTFDSRPAKRNKYSDVRYHALNLHSWVYRGTVECRLHTGSIEPHKIIAWGVFWASMLDYAMRTPESTIAGLRFATLAEAQAFMHDVIAPTDEVREYLRDRWQRFGHAYDREMTTTAEVA